jgi:hypothetical protein
MQALIFALLSCFCTATSGASSSAARSLPASSASPVTSVRLRKALIALLCAIDSIQVIGSDRPS